MDHFYRPEDQSKIRLAIGLRRVDAEDVPETAKHRQVAPTSTGPSQRKRKLEYEASFGSEGSPPSSSQPGSSQPLSRTSGPSSSQITQPVEDIEDEEYLEASTAHGYRKTNRALQSQAGSGSHHNQEGSGASEAGSDDEDDHKAESSGKVRDKFS